MSIFLINKNLVKTWHFCIDEQLPIERFTDDEIIATVQNVEDEEDEEDKEKSDKEYVPQSMISLKTALTSVDNLMRFVNDPPSGFVFNKKALSVLRSLKSEMSRYQTDKLSQSQIDNFINGST